MSEKERGKDRRKRERRADRWAHRHVASIQIIQQNRLMVKYERF
jgi:hypothetical protein